MSSEPLDSPVALCREIAISICSPSGAAQSTGAFSVVQSEPPPQFFHVTSCL